MQRLALTSLMAIVALGMTGCWADDAGRAAGTLDDLVRQITKKTGGSSDDAARWLRSLGSTEDEAVQIGRGMVASSLTVATGEVRVGNWVDEAIAALTPEQRAQVRGIVLGATCDAIDSAAQGEVPDLGSIVVNGLGSLSANVDQQLLRDQLTDMFNDLQPGGEATFTARAEVLFACMVLDS